jgi:hypothetical protein
MKRLAVCLLLAASGLLLQGWLRTPAIRNGASAPAATVPASSGGEYSPAADTRADLTAAPPEQIEDIAAMRQDRQWGRPVKEPAFAEFKLWTDEFTRGRRTREEGVDLARARRAALADLISKDPQRALELAVPESVRRTLPAEIQSELEERVNGRGDLKVAAALALPGREREVPAVSRTVSIAGREFEAYTYGRRESAMSRKGLTIHGIALDGQLALSEWPARVLEPVEAAEARARRAAPPLCPVSGTILDENGDEVVLDFSLEEAHWFCQAGHAMQELLAAAAQEAALPPGAAAAGGDGGGADPPVPQSDHTVGVKKMLIIRVDFPDKTGPVVSDATLSALINNMSNHWSAMSYGRVHWLPAGEGSAITPTLRLPLGHANYTSLGPMQAAALAAAEDAGYDYRSYDFDIVVTGDKPDVSFGGIAWVGARGVWLANSQWNLGVCSHELGHNFGLNHSGFWNTTDGSVIGAGTNVEYGNPFDHMGGASSSSNAHFSARQKAFLNWIPASSVERITADGTVTRRLTAMDRADAQGCLALAIDRIGTARDYWLEYRSLYSSIPWMQDGAVINFGDVIINNAKPSLLDFTPYTTSRNDCPVLIGRTFSDPDYGIHLTPVGRGSTNGVPWLDVTISRGTFPENRKPTASLEFSPSNPGVNVTTQFTVHASDPDGDALSWFWDWGDGGFTTNNGPAASHAWSLPGIKTVRCTVSDMKGLTATASVLIQVGFVSTFFISGHVRTADGLPFEGVTVSAGSAADTTDSEGFYAVTGLATGSYPVTAFKPGHTFQISGFTNPVTVGPGQTNANFVAPAGAPVFGALKPAIVNAGGSTGAMPLMLSDNDTPVAALTLTAQSPDPALIPGNAIVFGAGDPRTVTVNAPGGVSGTVILTLTATDPQNHSTTALWPMTVNAPPMHVAPAPVTAENVPLDMDLRTFVTDDLTPPEDMAFRVDRVFNGAVELLADGHTARFTPPPGYRGPASFRLISRDRSLNSRVWLLYDFEAGSGGDIANGNIADLSNFNRPGTVESVGNGEYSIVADRPAALAPHSTVSLSLTENGSGGAAALKRTISAPDWNWNDADWTFCAWVKRNSTGSEDFVFYLGDGDGPGPHDELELFFAAGSGELKLQKQNATGLQAAIGHPNIPAGEWHHLGITYDRTGANAGTLTLFVDGFFVGTVKGVDMAVDPARPMIVGGHADTSASSLTRWLDGRLDDVLLAGAVLSRAELRRLATLGAAHSAGLSAVDIIPVTVTGANDAPAIFPPGDIGMNTGLPSLPLKFRVTDPENEGRELSVSGTSSNPALIPHSGIAIDPVPAAWSSTDIGITGPAGSTTEDHGTLLITGGGDGIGGDGDAFRFVSQELEGGCELICRVVSVDYTHPGARAGIMLRDGTAVDAPFAMIALSAGDGVQYLSRLAPGGVTERTAPVNFIAAPVWLRLVRAGTVVTGYFAPDRNGAPDVWQTAGTDIAFSTPPAMKAGIAVTGLSNTSPTTALVDHAGGSFLTRGERTVTLTPVSGQTGEAEITLRVSDGTATTTGTFRAVVGINAPPAISAIPDLSVMGGQVPGAFTVTLGDLHTPPSSLTLTASSSNSLLLPGNRIVISGTGALRTVQVRPVPGETGSATITLTVHDGTAGSSVSFQLHVGPGDPSLLVSAGTNWRYRDSGTVPANWNTLVFDDSAWLEGPAQLGFGDGDENTLLSANPARKTTYFRRRFQLPDPALYQWLQLQVLRDDGAVIYLNGEEIQRTNMPEGTAITASTDAIAAVNNIAENRFFPFTVRRPPFVAGTNVLAVELHQKGTTSDDLSFDLEARGLHPSPIEAVPRGAMWNYLDTGMDPGPGWTSISYVDAAWKSGPAQLGFGDEDETTVIEGGPDNAHYVTTWFRKRFDITDLSAISGIGLRFLRDDGIQVWLNDQLLFRDNLPSGADASTFAPSAIGTAGESTWQTVWLPPDLLLYGPNQLAVDVHQSSPTSTDLSFDLQFLLYTADSLPPLTATATGGQILLTWPLWAAAWQVQSSADMDTWVHETETPAAGSNAHSLTLPYTTARKYFRLALP